VSCSSPSSSSTPPNGPAPTAAAPAPQQLWGDMKAVVSVKELMRDLIDPLSDNIFEAVAIIKNKHGTVERKPTTEEDWDRIRIGATAMAEASYLLKAYLLKVQRPFAPAGDLNNSVGPHAVELAPDQIRAKVLKDPVEWNARIEALRNVGLQVLDIVKRKNVDELWDASENLDNACENCHRSYWYPGETPAYYAELRRIAEGTNRRPGSKPRSPDTDSGAAKDKNAKKKK
jgi:hypothetical protein